MSKYWEKRFEQIKLDAMSKSDVMVEDLASTYAYSLQQLQKEVEDWYHKYAKDNNITLSDARKQLDKRELKAFKMTLNQYIRMAKEQNAPDEHIKMLNNASIRVRLDRSQQLLLQVTHYVTMLANTQNLEMSKLLADVYFSSTYKTAYETQSMMSKYKNVPLLSDEAVTYAISKPWTSDGKEFSSRIWDNRDDLVSTLQIEITRSLLIQEGSGKLADRIAKRYNVSFNNARRLAETETAYIQEKASFEQYKELDLEQYQILATLDNRTSSTCRHLDGKIVDMKDYKVGITAPPFHCHCRTTAIPYIKGITDFDDTRASRDDTSKTKYVPNMTYYDWYSTYVK